MKSKKIRKTKNRKTKNRKTKNRKIRIGGLKCNRNISLENLKNIIIKDGLWEIELSDMSDSFDIKINRREHTKINHHPVILFICQIFGFTINEALEFYCSERNNTIRDEILYKSILEKYYIYENINEANRGTLLSNFIKQTEKEWPENPNKLQPNMFHLFMLHTRINEPIYKRLISIQLSDDIFSKQEKWKSYLDLFTGIDPIIDLFKLGSGHDADLDERAGIIAERCIRNKNINKLYTMDGHGRFLCKLIQHLFYRDRNFFENRNLNIYVCDTDEETHLWHRTTMPIDVSINADIFESLNNSIDNNTIGNNIYYLNFSGLEGQNQKVLTAFEKIIKRGHLDNILASFFTVRGASSTPNDNIDANILIGKIQSLSNDRIKPVTNREGFVTLGTTVGSNIDYSTRII
jgi:hypothetical protein